MRLAAKSVCASLLSCRISEDAQRGGRPHGPDDLQLVPQAARLSSSPGGQGPGLPSPSVSAGISSEPGIPPVQGSVRGLSGAEDRLQMPRQRLAEGVDEQRLGREGNGHGAVILSPAHGPHEAHRVEIQSQRPSHDRGALLERLRHVQAACGRPLAILGESFFFNIQLKYTRQKRQPSISGPHEHRHSA